MGKQAISDGWCFHSLMTVCMVFTFMLMTPASAQQTGKTAAQNYVDGVNYFTQSRMRDAERAFLLALRSEPANKAAWMGLTDVYRAQNRLDEGIDATDKAISHHPGDPEFWIRKGAFLREAGRKGEACAALERAVEVSSSDQAVVKRVKNELFFDRDASGRINLGAGK